MGGRRTSLSLSLNLLVVFCVLESNVSKQSKANDKAKPAEPVKSTKPVKSAGKQPDAAYGTIADIRKLMHTQALLVARSEKGACIYRRRLGWTGLDWTGLDWTELARLGFQILFLRMYRKRRKPLLAFIPRAVRRIHGHLQQTGRPPR